MCMMFGAILKNHVLVGAHPPCSPLLMPKEFLIRSVLGFFSFLAIFPCWATSSVSQQLHQKCWIHWRFVLEDLICHKTWNKARGNFFIRFFLHKIFRIIGGKVVFCDKSNFPASMQAVFFKPAILCRALSCTVFSTCALSFLFCCV